MIVFSFFFQYGGSLFWNQASPDFQDGERLKAVSQQ